MLQHHHLIIRAECLFPPNHREPLNDWMLSIVNKLNMKVMSGPHTMRCDHPGNEGWTSVCVIETSHICFHSWDNIYPAVIEFDSYSCQTFDPYDIFELFNQFIPKKIEYKFIDRTNGLITINEGTINK